MEKVTGARVIADMFKGYGVTHVFMVPAALRMSLAEMERRTEIIGVQTHGEKAAAYMADGYARATGTPGICMAQVVGALNLAAGLRDAFLAHAPVIALTGGRDPRSKFRNVYQEIDDVPSFEPVTKFNATVDVVERIPDMLTQCFREAVSGVPGPVHLQFRGNEAQLDQDEGAIAPMVDVQYAKVPPFRPKPEMRHVQSALDLLQMAEKPVLVAGGGVRASGAGAEVIALAEKLQIPVVTSLNGKDTIPAAHPLSCGVVGTYSRQSANQLVAACDLICFVGSTTGGMTTHFYRVPPVGIPAIQIDIEATSMGRNYPLKVAVLGDAKATLAAMIKSADPQTAQRRKSWVARAQELRAEWYATVKPLVESDTQPMRPERILGELNRLMPDDAIVIADTGHAGMWMGTFFDVRGKQSYFRSAGHLGWAFSAGIGAKCAVPDRPVVVFIGDSGFWYHIGEIETAVRARANLITVVNNNNGGNQVLPGYDRAYGGKATEKARALWTFQPVNFARIAAEMGAIGVRIEKASDLGPALNKAWKADRPVVLDVVTTIDAFAPLAVLR
jgi:acetolactate synthase-1/2/3 large subunit